MDTSALLRRHPHYRAWWHLARVYHRMAEVLTAWLEGHGLTGTQFGVLRCALDAGDEGLMLSQLSRRLMVTCGNITGVVDRLETAGYLRRERDPHDRRVIRARLTQDGERLIRRLIPEHLALLQQLSAGLPPEDQDLLASLCERWESEISGGAAPEAPPATAAPGGRP